MSDTLLERARKIYDIAHVETRDNAIELIMLALRIMRDEGIKTGLDQAQRFSHELEKAS